MIKLINQPTNIPNWEKEGKKKALKKTLKQIGELQYQMYAQKEKSLLIVFQGTDASGKDGLVRKLFKYGNPISISVKSFKKPTPEEYSHDFLWRVHKNAPSKGWVQIFIRSHYEDILVPTVGGFYSKEIIEERYQLINQFEQLLQHNGTTILKFYLHVSPEEQEKRLRERLVNNEKYWKHNDGDWATREKFNQYMKVYENILNRCNSVPWHIIPADKNLQKLSMVSSIVLDAMIEMKIEWPDLQTEFTNLNIPE